MEQVFQAVNHIFEFVTPVSDFFWEFPCNFSCYAGIPILGNFSLAIILLVGSGIFFSFKTGFIQVTYFKKGIKLLAKKKSDETGISSLAAFLLSSAMRVGPGNILGVTGAISVGGPGALLWMWISAFFGMATAYTEAVLSQIFKERKGNEFVGGLPFYGKKLLGNKIGADILLSVMFIIYAMCCLPAQGFNVVSSIGQMAAIMTGSVLALVLLNYKTIPYFFTAVIGGAFTPEAIFGGAFGTVLAQGVKRGLMSNEAGQGTITMAAGAANTEHPCEQGCVQSIGVFLDTMVICTLTVFVVVMAHIWTGAEGEAWFALDRLPRFLASAQVLTPGTAFNSLVAFLLTLCFCLFAFPCLIGMISFSEIAANRISRKKGFIRFIRILGIALPLLVPTNITLPAEVIPEIDITSFMAWMQPVLCPPAGQTYF